ncbi:MAG: type II toxin-antitoxin system HicA family toxin [Coleofasciculaceae cyanobacterium]
MLQLIPHLVASQPSSNITREPLMDLNNKQRKILESIFTNPTPSNILWKDIESLLIALGADVSQGEGSRIRVKLNEVRAVFHEPHPQKETDRGAVKSVKEFLIEAGIEP